MYLYTYICACVYRYICISISISIRPPAPAKARAHALTQWRSSIPRDRNKRHRCHRRIGVQRVQRLEVLVAVMLARERRAQARSVQRRSPRLLRGRASDRCTALAAALSTLPSGLLEMVADAVAALGHADA
jgi:hypothetical protein